MEYRRLQHFELRELRYFVAVAEELHFARAAQRVGINQSPLSKAITSMERQLRVRLFVRDRRSTKLTPAGEMLLRDAREILMAANQARLALVAAAEGRTGRLRIAVGDDCLAHPRIADLLRRSRAEDPGVEVQVINCKPSEQPRMLRVGLLDIGLVASAPDLHSLFSLDALLEAQACGLGDDLKRIPLWKDRVSVVLQRNHPRATDSEIDWDSFECTELIFSDERSPECRGPSALIDLTGRTRRLHVVPSAGLVLTLAAAGKGVGLLSSEVARTINRADVTICPLKARRPHVTTDLLRRRDDDSSLIARFVDRALRNRDRRCTWPTTPLHKVPSDVCATD